MFKRYCEQKACALTAALVGLLAISLEGPYGLHTTVSVLMFGLLAVAMVADRRFTAQQAQLDALLDKHAPTANATVSPEPMTPVA
jgi:hypothetical protein